MRRTIAFVAVLVLGIGLGLSAQNRTSTLTLYTVIQQLSTRVDILQRRADQYAGPAESRQSLDVVEPYQVGDEWFLRAQGWAFSCSPDATHNFGSVYVVIDDLEIPLSPQSRPERLDVVAAFAGFCGDLYVPALNGQNYEIPMAIFGSGPSEDGWHAVKLRTYDRYGRMSETDYTHVRVPPIK